MSRALSWSLAMAIVVAAFVPGLAAEASNSARPMFGPQDLWGAILSPGPGWGSLQTNVANPGPTINVVPGENVNLTLRSADGLGHTFWVDYNGNNLTNPPGEPVSPVFGGATPLSYQFTATGTPGKYWYKCSIHGWSMRGPFIVAGGVNQPPTIQLTNPDGVATNRWTGGSVHRVTWMMADPDDPPGALTVWLNYTANGGSNSGPIAGPLLGVGSWDWTVPAINANDARVLAAIADGRGGSGSDNKLIPLIDSTPPIVSAVTPLDGATGVALNAPILLNFSESMNEIATQNAFSLNPTVAGLNFAWSNVDRTLTVTHAPFAGSRLYAATLDTTAKDASDPGLAMASPFSWSFRTANAPPSVTVTSPGPGVRWTGGSTHTLAWTATDSEDPPSNLTVQVEYSPTGTGPWTLIVGPVAGTTTSFNWAVPLVDTTAAKTRTTVNDTGGGTTQVLSGAFAIDSTPPAVSTTNPAGGANGVALNTNVAITFSEAMNKSVTGVPSVVGLQAIPSGPWVTLSFSWDGPGIVLTANPPANLQASTSYRIFVNASALDASDPGNPMIGGVTFDFTTGSAADTTPPTITNVQVVPPTNRTGGSIDVSATVTDNAPPVASVSVNVTRPDSTWVNRIMTDRGGNRWGDTNAWTQVGTYTFMINARDGSGNSAAPAAGSFQITAVDSTAPVIQHTPPSGTIRVGDVVTITATVTDPDGQADVAVVKLAYTDTAGAPHNVSMTSYGSSFTATIPAQAATGTLRYRIYAEDAAGNWNVTLDVMLDIQAATPTPAGDYTALILGLVLVIAVALAAIVLFARRRKRGGDPEARLPPTMPEK